jgi:hypothetical protein
LAFLGRLVELLVVSIHILDIETTSVVDVEFISIEVRQGLASRGSDQDVLAIGFDVALVGD